MNKQFFKPFMTISEFAVFYSTSKLTVRRWMYKGKITAKKNGKEYRLCTVKTLKQLGWSDEEIRLVTDR